MGALPQKANRTLWLSPGTAGAAAGDPQGPLRAPSRLHTALRVPCGTLREPRPTCWAPEVLLEPSPLGSARPPPTASPPVPALHRHHGEARSGTLSPGAGWGPSGEAGLWGGGAAAQACDHDLGLPGPGGVPAGKPSQRRPRSPGAGPSSSPGVPRTHSALERRGHTPGARLRPDRDLGLASTPVCFFFLHVSPSPRPAVF